MGRLRGDPLRFRHWPVLSAHLSRHFPGVNDLRAWINSVPFSRLTDLTIPTPGANHAVVFTVAPVHSISVVTTIALNLPAGTSTSSSFPVVAVMRPDFQVSPGFAGSLSKTTVSARAFSGLNVRLRP